MKRMYFYFVLSTTSKYALVIKRVPSAPPNKGKTVKENLSEAYGFPYSEANRVVILVRRTETSNDYKAMLLFFFHRSRRILEQRRVAPTTKTQPIPSTTYHNDKCRKYSNAS